MPSPTKDTVATVKPSLLYRGLPVAGESVVAGAA